MPSRKAVGALRLVSADASNAALLEPAIAAVLSKAGYGWFVIFWEVETMVAFSLLLGLSLAPTASHNAQDLRPVCTPSFSEAALAPSNSPKFANLIENIRFLQIDGDDLPGTTTCLRKTELARGGYDPNNWRMEHGNMLFSFKGGERGNRVELRGESFAANASKTLSARLMISRTDATSKGLTFAQVFSQSLSRPILRLELISYRARKRDHVWAIYRYGTGSGQSVVKDLGPVSEGFADLNIDFAQNDALHVSYNGASVNFRRNVALWRQTEHQNFFKAGCYLQRDGDCTVIFSDLSFD